MTQGVIQLMKCSIIIPAYNTACTLEATVNSIMTCGLSDYEIILIDDGSIDDTPVLCDHLAQTHERIRAYHQKNSGVSSARNYGLKQATGDYIWFVDSDDFVNPFSDSFLHDCNVQSPDMIIFGMEVRSYRDNVLMQNDYLRMPKCIDLYADQFGELFPELFVRNYLSPTWNKLFNRNLLIRSQIEFDPSLSNYEDLVFSLQALSVSKHILISPETIYVYITDYDHDRTVDRIAKIDNVAENTDLIASAFFAVSHKCGFNADETRCLKKIVFDIYLNLFGVKMQTTPLRQIKKQCSDYSSDVYLSKCLDVLPDLSENNQNLFHQICDNKVFYIWMKYRYRILRHKCSKFIKPFIHR